MASHSHKMRWVTRDVVEMARDRLRFCFDQFDRVVVAFSGGKDSTACLNLALEVAREKGKLPLEVFTFDEEAIPPETVEYMARIAANPDVLFKWYCLPVEHRNACSREQPYWYPWAPEDRDKWVRELPPWAITELKGFHRQATPEATPLMYPPSVGTVALVMGIRTQESMTRLRAVCVKTGFEAFLCRNYSKNITKAYPVYDWKVEDIWLAAERFGWDYNRAYDVMEAAGLSRNIARCSPPYGEQPIRRLWSYQVCWPELWERMILRVHGAATAARYANTELYGVGVKDEAKPSEVSWEEYTRERLMTLDPETRAELVADIKGLIRQHHSYTHDVMPDETPHRLSGFCWKYIYPIAASGGNKLGRQAQKSIKKALEARKEQGVPSISTIDPKDRPRKVRTGQKRVTE